ncbi:MAG: FAD-dependent oxidoreductase [Myxococcales bacterium]|nr:FAD-dependent oxidoreductase [Myxococcales bacterium]
MLETEDVDVVVVGAGLAGLRCARLLEDAGSRVCVLEARDRVGGRTYAAQVGASTFDLGGQWIGPAQRRVTRLVAELGLETFPTFTEGRKVFVSGGRRRTYGGEIPNLSVLQLLRMQLALTALERRRRHVPPTDPMRAPDAEALDAMTLETLRARYRLDAPTRGAMDAALRTIFGAEASDLSALFFLAYLNAGGGLLALAGARGGAQEARIVGGAHSIARRLAEGLDVRLSAPVRRVVRTKGSVEIEADGLRVRARRAVLAIPAPLLPRLRFEPALEAPRASLLARGFMGATTKVLALYDEPFWRAEGLSGELVTGDGPISVTFDNTSHDGAQPALVGFVVGRHARELSALSKEAAEARVRGALARAFGRRAATPSALVLHDWSAETYSGGCPVGLYGPGALTSGSAHLRAPEHLLHFAGTETAREHTGYLEGALESAERAAAEVLAATRA